MAPENISGTVRFMLGGEALGTGETMYRLAGELYPMCRSITGEGVRETLRRLQAHLGEDKAKNTLSQLR